MVGEPEVCDHLFLLLLLDRDLLVVLILHHRLLVVIDLTAIVLVFLRMHLLLVALHFSTCKVPELAIFTARESSTLVVKFCGATERYPRS